MKKIINKTSQKLSEWLFMAPFKFALLSFCTMVGFVLIFAIIAGAFNMAAAISSAPVAILMIIGMIISIWMLIKWLPAGDLDRKSFIAVSNGQLLVYAAILALSIITVAIWGNKLVMYSAWLQYYSMTLFIILATAISLVYLYILGVIIANLYAIYWRARAMGVPKWKLILSIPFSFLLFWFPAYLIPDAKQSKTIVPIKSKWYEKLTSWIVAKNSNTIISLIAMIVIITLFFDIYSFSLMILFGIVFGVWALITGIDGLRKNIGNNFSTMAASVNIAMVIALAGLIIMATIAPRTAPVPTYAAPEITQNTDGK
jgi:hypothetical protein